MVLSACHSWAKETFGHACLGDPRRTRRLVTLAASLAQHAGLSIVKSSSSAADVEGAYRLMCNPHVTPEAIADAGFSATAKAAQAHPLLLALEDTTAINFSHSCAYDELGNTSTSQKTRACLPTRFCSTRRILPGWWGLLTSSAGAGTPPRTGKNMNVNNDLMKIKRASNGRGHLN